jgi:predicted transcriptional regulator
MSPTRTVTLTDELYEQASQEAQAEGKTTDEITRDALIAYLALRQLDRLQEYGQQRANGLGLTEADIPRLIAESRRESRQYVA